MAGRGAPQIISGRVPVDVGVSLLGGVGVDVMRKIKDVSCTSVSAKSGRTFTIADVSAPSFNVSRNKGQSRSISSMLSSHSKAFNSIA